MPQSKLNHPPPAKPAMDKSVRDLQVIVKAMNIDMAARGKGSRAVQAPILEKLASQDLEKCWAKYDAYSSDDLSRSNFHPGDLLYFHGDVIEIVEKTTENWALGRCRGRLGVFPLEQTVPGPFVVALSDYTARDDREISFKKGEVMPAIPGQQQAVYTVFKKAQYGECLRTLFTTMDHQPSVEECRHEPQKYYQYSTLQPGQIRLFYITPSDVEQFIACGRQSLFVAIHHAPLDNINGATALSYCWGDPADKKPIFANGKLLYIPSTLWRAMRRAYPENGLSAYMVLEHSEDRVDPKGPAIFWADAICINQEDTLEKNHQIPLMRSIYSKAREVLVYVGEGATQFPAVLIMKVIAETAEQFAPWTVVPDRVIRDRMSRMDWNCVREFLSRQVFRRSWVIQEIVLATELTICSGMTRSKLDQILDCVKAIRMNHVRHVDSLLGFPAWTRNESQEFRDATVQLYNLANISSRRREGSTVNFLEILESFRHAKATDPRDKVYSLLSLASEAYQNGIVPDYSTSNTATSVFLGLARCAVTIGDIELLLRNAGGSQAISGLPSWVPDWTYDSRNVIPSDQYSCGGAERKCRASLSPTNSQLSIRGSLFDKITRKSPKLDWAGHGDVLDTFGTLSVAILAFHHLLSMSGKVVDALGGIYLSGDDLLTAVWQTLVCGLGWSGKRTQDSDKKHFEAFLECCQDQITEMRASNDGRIPISIGTKFVRTQAELEALSKQDTRTRILTNEPVPAPSPELEQQTQLEEKMYPFITTMLHHQAERRTCLTGKGYLGTVPSEAEEGDLTVIFFGLGVPFVLRPLTGGTYKLIGPCYIHGIMDGEGLRSDAESVDFVLV
ncbi:hypothetical protein GP486_004829 [Trichoglossum hirsutum]|uniref:Heterokaryon incompatibility domain-containing protein n=1 Tax=Trichoglossum hirsutum TaxID=265104 RepID=A0A9P8LAE4_9PEZI|nr:hypothetical protein GP486_004829 [Trichoglossum hirsutum]